MKIQLNSLLKRLAVADGQAIPIIAVMMVGMLGVVALVVDVGRVYYSYHQLQNSSDAAALAGAQALPGATAVTVANTYSSIPGGKNVFTNLVNVQMVSGYPKIECLTALKNNGIACVAPASGNAIQVKQQADVPMYFAQIFGTRKVTVTATATASMRGATASPYNIAIIVDATGSMSTYDSGTCNNTRLTCALQGVQTLLAALNPCGASQASCGTATNGMVSNSVDRVSLFTFPNLTAATQSKEFDCSSSSPTIWPYTFPSATATSLTTMPYTTGGTTYQMTYQAVPFSSDYRVSDTATTLNTGSNLSLAVGGKSGCTGLTNPGGQGTYYAGALYQAQGALLAQQAANPGSENVIVLLSDGDATASQTQMAGGTTSTTVATASGTYPSWNNKCGQAIIAAKAIAAAGTTIFSVAYGAASSGCSSDTTGPYAYYTPCQTMEAIASSPENFFSDSVASQNAGQCISSSQPTTNLNQIFTQIAGSLTLARLIPDSTT